MGGERQLTQLLAAAGVEILVNRNVTLPRPSTLVSICGIDDPWTGSADVAQAFKDRNSDRIFLTHSPDGLLLLGDEKFDGRICGHTHGGQIALPDELRSLSRRDPSAALIAGQIRSKGNGP